MGRRIHLVALSPNSDNFIIIIRQTCKCLANLPPRCNKDPSPNSGWSECAYAAVLGVQMGGVNWYGGVAKHKPLLGDPIYPITPDSIDQALKLTRYGFLSWLGLAIVIFLIP